MDGRVAAERRRATALPRKALPLEISEIGVFKSLRVFEEKFLRPTQHSPLPLESKKLQRADKISHLK